MDKKQGRNRNIFGENGKIFGGVSAKDISENLEKQHNINDKLSENHVDTALIEYKESFFTRFKNFIFKILHINQ